MNLTIPMNVTTGGAVPVELMIGGVATADSLTVALQ